MFYGHVTSIFRQYKISNESHNIASIKFQVRAQLSFGVTVYLCYIFAENLLRFLFSFSDRLHLHFEIASMIDSHHWILIGKTWLM